MTKFRFQTCPLNISLTKAISLALLFCSLAALLPCPAPAAQVFPTYNLVDLGILPGGDRSYARGINNANQVVGESSVPPVGGVVTYHAFRYDYSSGTMYDLGTLGGRYSYAYAINNDGKITGNSEPTPYVIHAFLYGEGGMTDLGVLPGGNTSLGYAINTLGQVVGMSMVPPPSGSGFWPYHAFLYSGVMTDLGVTSTPGFDQTEAYGINDNGWVVGKTTPPGGGFGHAFVYAGGVMTDVGVAWEAAGYYSEAKAVNNAGQILMNAMPTHGGGTSYAAIYQAGNVSVIGDLGGNSGRALALNAAGQVVGRLGNGNAFLYVPLNGLVELSALVVGTNPFSQLQSATAITDLGYIAGYGTLAADGSTHAFLGVPGPGWKRWGDVPYLLLLD